MGNDLPAVPERFSELAPLVSRWARPTENERAAIRWSAAPEDFAALYLAVMPQLQDVLNFLADYEPETMDGDVRNLFYLACAFAEAAPHHELYRGSASVPHSFDARRFVPMHGDLSS